MRVFIYIHVHISSNPVDDVIYAMLTNCFKDTTHILCVFADGKICTYEVKERVQCSRYMVERLMAKKKCQLNILIPPKSNGSV